MLDVNRIFALFAVERFGQSLINFVHYFLFFFGFRTFHCFHLCLNRFLNKLKFFLFSVKLNPNREGRSFFGRENATFPHTQYSIHSEFVLEKWNVNRSRKFLVNSGFNQVLKQLVPFRTIHR